MKKKISTSILIKQVIICLAYVALVEESSFIMGNISEFILNASDYDKITIGTNSPSLSPTISREKRIETSTPTMTPIPTMNPTGSQSPTISLEYDKIGFNYDPESVIGPYHWEDIPESDYSSYYSTYLKENKNECGKSRQSPISIKIDDDDDECTDDHSPNLSRGSFKFSELNFIIQPTSLRAIFPNEKGIPRPKTDWSNLSDALRIIHVDIKLKSEHHLSGRQYAGEFQLYFFFPETDHESKKHDELVVMSILMDDSEDIENPQLEQFIRQWEETARKRVIECARRNNTNTPMYVPSYFNVFTDEYQEQVWDIQRKSRSDFNIFRFMPTGWYCGYKGTLTEPPCTQKVHWRILDLPMKISVNQFTRMQNLLVNRIDSDCVSNATVAFNGTVNRPLGKRKKLKTYCCTSQNWPFREKDPLYWLDSWPDEYHGWKSVRNKNFTNV